DLWRDPDRIDHRSELHLIVGVTLGVGTDTLFRLEGRCVRGVGRAHAEERSVDVHDPELGRARRIADHRIGVDRRGTGRGPDPGWRTTLDVLREPELDQLALE